MSCLIPNGGKGGRWGTTCPNLPLFQQTRPILSRVFLSVPGNQNQAACMVEEWGSHHHSNPGNQLSNQAGGWGESRTAGMGMGRCNPPPPPPTWGNGSPSAKCPALPCLTCLSVLFGNRPSKLNLGNYHPSPSIQPTTTQRGKSKYRWGRTVMVGVVVVGWGKEEEGGRQEGGPLSHLSHLLHVCLNGESTGGGRVPQIWDHHLNPPPTHHLT